MPAKVISDSRTGFLYHVQDNPLPSLQRPESDASTKKMAIPRLAEGAEPAFTSPGRYHRRHVRRACESCRQRKTKCTGDRAGCRNCREAGIICCYTDGKREKSKRSVKTSFAFEYWRIARWLILPPAGSCPVYQPKCRPTKGSLEN